MGEFDGKVAIITGAGRRRSIGRTTALSFAQQGADVVITGTGRDPSTLPPDEKEVGWRDIESVAEEIRGLGRRALPLVMDVTNSSQVQGMVDQTLKEFGRVDILVNNAAFPRGPDRVPTVDLDKEIWRRVIDVKLTGSFLCAQAVARVLLKQGQGGKIINMSSDHGRKAGANVAAYASANGGVQHFTTALAMDLAPHHINVNCVCPAIIDTARNDDRGYPRGEKWAEATRAVPLGRAGTPEEVAGFILWLCSDAADFITGQCININGGMVMEH